MKLFAILLAASSLAMPPAWGADAPAKPSFVEKPITPALFREIRNGGFVLYMRHGNTDNSHPDRVPSVDLNDCSTQRPLSDDGRQLMRQVGKALRDAKLPIGDVLVSPMCRTLESARLAIGEKFQVVESLMYSANMTSEEKKPRIEALKKLLAQPVAKGTNTLMIAHAPNIDDLIGFFVKPEGTIIVFRLGGPNVYEYVASIHPDDWRNLPK